MMFSKKYAQKGEQEKEHGNKKNESERVCEQAYVCKRGAHVAAVFLAGCNRSWLSINEVSRAGRKISRGWEGTTLGKKRKTREPHLEVSNRGPGDAFV